MIERGKTIVPILEPGPILWMGLLSPALKGSMALKRVKLAAD
jgi:hypothetical protein